jgi:hypothetical protein
MGSGLQFEKEKPEIKQIPSATKVEEPKETKKETSDIDDYEDNWDMSDHDLQDNSENKPVTTKEKESSKNNNIFDSKLQNVVNFDEIPSHKDNKNNKQSDMHTKIDFFGT